MAARSAARILRYLLLCALTVGSLLAQQKEGGRGRLRQMLVAQGQLPAGVGLTYKLHKAEGEPDCMEIVEVTAGSLAEKAGIKTGDLVVSANGRPLTVLPMFMSVLRGPAKVSLEIRRDGQTLTLPLTLPDAAPLGGDPFTVPGVPRGARGSGSINTLRTVFIDPRTGSTAFLGAYDPAFATGPIDYAGLLGDARRSPYPAFSLDPSPASRVNRESLLRKVDADMA